MYSFYFIESQTRKRKVSESACVGKFAHDGLLHMLPTIWNSNCKINNSCKFSSYTIILYDIYLYDVTLWLQL